MDAKITKTRLSRMLSYDWIKIVGFAAGLIFIWVLILTMTATQITAAQQFTVHTYTGVSYQRMGYTGKLYSIYNDVSADVTKDTHDILSHEIIEFHTEDLNNAGQDVNTVLEARLTVGDGDLVFVANYANEAESMLQYKRTDENGEEQTYTRTYLESLALQYNLYDVDKYFTAMEGFLNQYYKGDWTVKENIDKVKIEADFRARIKKNKDKRYKKESQIQAALPLEYKRIEKYRDGLEEFYGYEKAGIVARQEVVVPYMDVDKVWPENKGKFGLNLCPAGSEQMKKLSDYIWYDVTVQEEGEEEQTKSTAENMCVAFYNVTNMKDEEGYQYENLLFVNRLIASVLADGQAEGAK